MILHIIDWKYTCIEPMNNRTEGGIILARQRALYRIRDQEIAPKNQVLNKKILAAYGKEIRATHMTLKLVRPNDHCRNLA